MLITRLTLTLLMLLTASTASATARLTSQDLTSFKLDNGLKLYVLEDHRAPLAVTQMWYQVGSADEVAGTLGISHMLEHMSFKGSKQFPGNSASQQISRLGGIENAFTSRDYTVYHYQLAAAHVDTALRIEAGRMSALQLDAEQFTSERQVVLQERQRNVEDRPNAMLFEQFYLNAYATSPYRQPVIGWPEDINRWTIDDIKEWYNRWYLPANSVLVVAGDVDPDAIYKRVKALFGPLPGGKTPQRNRLSEVKSSISRQIELTLPAQVPLMVMGFRAPSLLSASAKQVSDVYALQVLSAVLSEGQSARLYDDLVRKQQIASLVDTSFSPLMRDDALFMWLGQPADGVQLSALQDAFTAQIEALQTIPLEPADLDRIKTRVKALTIYERDALFGRAMEIGQLASLGLSLDLIDQFEANIQAVTSDAVMEAAQRYFTPERRTIARLVPASDSSKEVTQ